MNFKLAIAFIFFIGAVGLYSLGEGSLFLEGTLFNFAAVILVSVTLYFYIDKAKSGEDIFLRPIAGLKAFEEAVGRATEMGKSVLFVPGISDMDQVETVSGLILLGHVAGMTAQYEAGLNVPVSKSIVMEAGRETCREAYLKAGRPDLYYDDMVHYLTDDQFAYAAGVNGIMIREKPAAVFYQGKFYAESLILAETGNSIGAIQIAGTGSPAQIPFFVTACDYTLIGEEFFAASAYLSKKPELLGSIKGQDIVKFFIICLIFFTISIFGFRQLEYSGADEWDMVKSNYNLEANQKGQSIWSEKNYYGRFETLYPNIAYSVEDSIKPKITNLTWNNLAPKDKMILASDWGGLTYPQKLQISKNISNITFFEELNINEKFFESNVLFANTNSDSVWKYYGFEILNSVKDFNIIQYLDEQFKELNKTEKSQWKKNIHTNPVLNAKLLIIANGLYKEINESILKINQNNLNDLHDKYFEFLVSCKIFNELNESEEVIDSYVVFEIDQQEKFTSLWNTIESNNIERFIEKGNFLELGENYFNQLEKKKQQGVKNNWADLQRNIPDIRELINSK